eukprot:GEZU01015743.1.p1 GENE.GEZU01015743.1~~GEZU01015743.1.p1  ORF type:complete len:146 (+),score=27.94 GEZU01015743.1:131-568(+)
MSSSSSSPAEEDFTQSERRKQELEKAKLDADLNFVGRTGHLVGAAEPNPPEVEELNKKRKDFGAGGIWARDGISPRLAGEGRGWVRGARGHENKNAEMNHHHHHDPAKEREPGAMGVDFIALSRIGGEQLMKKSPTIDHAEHRGY